MAKCLANHRVFPSRAILLPLIAETVRTGAGERRGKSPFNARTGHQEGVRYQNAPHARVTVIPLMCILNRIRVAFLVPKDRRTMAPDTQKSIHPLLFFDTEAGRGDDCRGGAKTRQFQA